MGIGLACNWKAKADSLFENCAMSCLTQTLVWSPTVAHTHAQKEPTHALAAVVVVGATGWQVDNHSTTTKQTQAQSISCM